MTKSSKRSVSPFCDLCLVDREKENGWGTIKVRDNTKWWESLNCKRVVERQYQKHLSHVSRQCRLVWKPWTQTVNMTQHNQVLVITMLYLCGDLLGGLTCSKIMTRLSTTWPRSYTWAFLYPRIEPGLSFLSRLHILMLQESLSGWIYGPITI